MVELCDDGELSNETLPNLCRLCLQQDDFIVDIFHRLDPNPNKKPLPERLYDLYQIKVIKSDGLPTNICHRCLYFTEAFSEFRENVRKCESRLQKFSASIGILGSDKPQNFECGIKTEITDINTSFGIEDYNPIVPDDDSLIVVVDPNQDYESSNEDFSLDSDDDEYAIQHKISQAQQAQPTTTAAPTTATIATSMITSETNVASRGNEVTRNNYNFQQDEKDDSLTLKNVFLCQYCDMAFISQIECAEHESRHDAANPYSCNYCPFRCASRQTVITHIKDLHDNERPYVCAQCDKTFGRRSDLKKHTTVHTGIRPFNCPVCGKNFSRNTNLTKHLRIHTSLRPYVCQKCPRSFTTPEDLRRHEKVHNNQKIFQCSLCPSNFTRKDKLVNHQLIHLGKAPAKSGKGKMAGASKSLVAQKMTQLQLKHQQLMEQKQLLQQQQQLQLQQQQQQFQLQQQQQQFQLQQQQQLYAENMMMPLDPFTNTQRVENPEINSQDVIFKKPLTTSKKSSKTSKSSKQKQQQQKQQQALLLQQEQQHLQQPPTQQQQQQQQQQQNTKGIPGQKPKRELRRNFICPVCSKAFLRRRELQRHSMVHTGIKPFPCQYCSKRFSRKDKANRHEKSHFEDKFPCPHCQMIFANQPALDTHLKVHELDRAISTAASQSQLTQQQQPMFPQMIPPGVQAPFGQPIGGYPLSHQQQQQHHAMMSSQPPMYQHQQQGFYHDNYRPPQLNFYSEIQPEN